MIPSRFQTQQGPYGPLLTAGLYPAPAPAAAAAPTAPAQGAVTPAATPAAAAPQSAPAPVSSGSVAQSDGGSASTNDPPGQVSPDQTFGGFMGALGSAASIGFGGPLGGLGMLGALGINSALGVPSFSMQTALDDLAQTAFGRTADVTAGMNGPAGTGAAVSSWGLSSTSDKPSGMEGGQKGDAKGDFGSYGSQPGDGGVASGDKGGPGEAPDGGAKGDAAAADAAAAADPGAAASSDPGGIGDSGGMGDGWMDGGYTGHGEDGVVQRDQPAGTVHEGEIVIPAPMVKHYGLDLLMGLVNGDVPKNRLAELARGAD